MSSWATGTQGNTNASLLTTGTLADARLPTAQQQATLLATYRSILGDPGAVESNVHYGAAAGLAKWNTALANVKTRDGKARIFVMGDSTSFGYYGAGYLGWVERFKELLNRTSPTREGIIYPTTAVIAGATKRAYVTLGTGWTSTVGYGLTGAGNLSAPAGTAASADFGPFYCNGFNVYYMRRATTGTMDLQVDAEAATNVGGTGADAIMVSTQLAAAVGNHTLHLKNVATGGVTIMGIEPLYGTGVGQGLYLANGGIPGTASAGWISYGSTPWDINQQVFVTNPPDLTIIALGINDMATNVLPGTFQTNLTAIVTTAQGVGSCLLVIQPARVDAVFTYPWSQYVAAINAVAVARNCPVVSLPTLIGGDITAQGGIFDSGDHIHWTDEMHYQTARAIFAALQGG